MLPLETKLKDEKGVQNIFNGNFVAKYKHKTETVLEFNNTFDLQSKCDAHFNYTRDRRLLCLKYRIFHIIIGTKYLSKCKILNNRKYIVCGTESGFIDHLFFHCHRSKQ